MSLKSRNKQNTKTHKQNFALYKALSPVHQQIYRQFVLKKYMQQQQRLNSEKFQISCNTWREVSPAVDYTEVIFVGYRLPICFLSFFWLVHIQDYIQLYFSVSFPYFLLSCPTSDDRKASRLSPLSGLQLRVSLQEKLFQGFFHG